MMRKLKVWELNRLSPDQFKKAPKLPLIAVLDSIRSLNNTGSLFRTADAFRLQALYLCGITPRPPAPEIHKTALGAEDSVDWQYFEHTTDAVTALKVEGYTVCAIEQTEGSVSLLDFSPTADRKYAFILGNEVQGVEQEVIDMCHQTLEIPQFGCKHSLNVAVTGGIIAWHFFEKMRHSF
jgi:tRNA G18 (ribose-2'-O)-methylase SpoU